jgi:hypothetical protein
MASPQGACCNDTEIKNSFLVKKKKLLLGKAAMRLARRA